MENTSPRVLVSYVREKAAEKSLAILRSSPEQATASLASDSAQSDDLLRPVFMGCATKNAKVVAISLGVAAAVNSPQGCTTVCCRTHRKHHERCHEPRRRHSTSHLTNLGFP
ncbi:hypothetical protein DFH29DRAFT_81737 [Suillus ampliporus]|nr:hypothetical protein DFH29DRAFT_81737 [Suillus ampliporus]